MPGDKKKFVIFQDAAAVALEERRQRQGLYGLTAVLASLLILYGGFRLVEGHGVRQGIIDLVLGGVLIVNAAAYPVHRKIWLAKPALVLFGGAFVLVLLSTGGFFNTAMYWVFVFPAVAYLFQGMRHGAVMILLFMSGVVGVALAQSAGALTTPYSSGQFAQAIIVLILIAAFGFVTEYVQDKLRKDVAAGWGRLRVVLENISTGIVVVEAPDGRTSAASAGVERILGRPVSADVKVADFPAAYGFVRENGSPYPSDELPFAVALKKGKSSVQADVHVRRPDGTDGLMRIIGAPVIGPDGKTAGAVAVCEDLTREREIDRMKSEFVSFASHQLKTPLTSIKWSLESLIGGDAGKLTPDQQGRTKEIVDIVDQITHLVTDLLQVSRLESGKHFVVTRKPIDARPVLDAVANELSIIAARRGITIVKSGLPAAMPVDGDADKLREVFMNLVGNAVKYSKDGGIVEIGTSKSRQRGEAIYVKDYGLGIPKAQQSRVFEKFFRAENVAETIEGTGLGLFIAKAIVDRHSGSIWFDSQEGKETTFFVAIPKQPKA